ncbi:MAG: hypothetical protein QXW79_01640 [Thermoplasmata archaeon]
MLEIFNNHCINIAGQPLLAKINYNTIDFYKTKNDPYDVKKISSIHHQNIFIDNSNNQKNSILIMKTLGKYIFIGPKIYSFTTSDLIIDFESSEVGHDVRPYATGMKYVYLMLEEVKIPKKCIGSFNPYIWLRHSASIDKEIRKFNTKPLRNLTGIMDP